MAKKKRTQTKTETTSARPAPKEPVSTHTGYQVAIWAIVLGLIAQLVMAFIVFPRLPAQIPSGWTGSVQPYNLVSKWVVFALFPGFELVLLLVSLFSPKNAEGKRTMQTGNAVTVVILAMVITALQASAFFINRP